MNLVAYTDGASRNNPGEAGIGIVIKNERGATVASVKKYLGVSTNNAAEYTALIQCLETVIANPEWECSSLSIYTDSELMARQMKGAYKIKEPNLKKLHTHAARLIASARFGVTITHVPRAMNKEADLLANEAIDSKA